MGGSVIVLYAKGADVDKWANMADGWANGAKWGCRDGDGVAIIGGVVCMGGGVIYVGGDFVVGGIAINWWCDSCSDVAGS